MSLSPSSLQSLRRVFHSSFSAHDITESLMSCNDSDCAEETCEFMSSRNLEVLGVRREGTIAGYIERSALGSGTCADYLQKFRPHEVILNSTPIAEVIQGLKEQPRLFVMVFGRVGGIVTRSDLQKPTVRMWLFGMVTLIEMRMTRMIEQIAEEGGWKQFLSDGRLKKAEELLEERMRRNQNLNLIDCLQFADKFQIIARNEHLRALTRFESRRSVEDVGKRLERLRNNLAHAQDIISTDWEAVIDLSENFDAVLNVTAVTHEQSP